MTTGPLSYLVVAFPGNQFKGEILPELKRIVDKGLIRIVDLIFIMKDQDGNVEGVELAVALAVTQHPAPVRSRSSPACRR